MPAVVDDSHRRRRFRGRGVNQRFEFPGGVNGMVLNLDKCIGCHTCSVTCKNVWTNREGMEYAWFNNVETKPGIGYPKEWENQKRWNGSTFPLIQRLVAQKLAV